jgi:hypothetical protein
MTALIVLLPITFVVEISLQLHQDFWFAMSLASFPHTTMVSLCSFWEC